MTSDVQSDAAFSAAIGDGFSGVATVHRHGLLERSAAFGLADRTFAVPNDLDIRYGLASITKAFTAVVVLSLVGERRLSLDQPVRTVLGDDLAQVADDVTIDHLLSQRSGIGDYFDEELDEAPTLRVPVQELGNAEAYLAAIDGFATKFAAGERFSYCNGGYVVLALVAERAAGIPYGDLVQERVFDPAGMATADLAPSDRLHPRTATGYRTDGTTNVFHLPLVGVGDGGAHATATDLDRFWRALAGGVLLSEPLTRAMLDEVTPGGETGGPLGYGRGVWLDAGRHVLQGGDEGVAAWSEHDPATGITLTLLANEETAMYRRVLALRDLVR